MRIISNLHGQLSDLLSFGAPQDLPACRIAAWLADETWGRLVCSGIDELYRAGCGSSGGSRVQSLAACPSPVDFGTNHELEQTSNFLGDDHMIRFAREGLALASVAGFVWMMCSVAHLVA